MAGLFNALRTKSHDFFTKYAKYYPIIPCALILFYLYRLNASNKLSLMGACDFAWATVFFPAFLYMWIALGFPERVMGSTGHEKEWTELLIMMGTSWVLWLLTIAGFFVWIKYCIYPKKEATKND
jgi:hypothetical protein